jgi:nucleoside-diphosphate-sugar epimerase
VNRRVLVTGASGFIGSHCVRVLNARDFEVHAPTRAQLNLMDVSQAEALIKSLRPTHLLHLAWYVEPGLYWTSPENLKWLEASSALLRLFALHGGERVVVAGTCAEYDWSQKMPLVERGSNLSPASPYGKAKDMLRQFLERLSGETTISAAWGRLFHLYGPGEHPKRLVPYVIQSLLKNERARCTEGKPVRDFLCVLDVANAYVSLLESKVEGPVNIASGIPVAIRDVIRTIGDLLGRAELIDFGALPQPEGEAPQVFADVTRLHNEVGWTRKYDLRQGLELTIDDWKYSHGSHH